MTHPTGYALADGVGLVTCDPELEAGAAAAGGPPSSSDPAASPPSPEDPRAGVASRLDALSVGAEERAARLAVHDLFASDPIGIVEFDAP